MEPFLPCFQGSRKVLDLDKLQTEWELEAYFDKFQGDLVHIWLELDKVGWGVMWCVTFSTDGVG